MTRKYLIASVLLATFLFGYFIVNIANSNKLEQKKPKEALIVKPADSIISRAPQKGQEKVSPKISKDNKNNENPEKLSIDNYFELVDIQDYHKVIHWKNQRGYPVYI